MKKEEELSRRTAEENSHRRRRNFKPAVFPHFHSAADNLTGFNPVTEGFTEEFTEGCERQNDAAWVA